MGVKSNLNVEYIDIDTNILQNTESLLNTDLRSSYERQFSEWAIFCISQNCM